LIVSPVSGTVNVPFPKNVTIECVWSNGVTPVFAVLSCQIGCADKCITDEDGLVAAAAAAAAVLVVAVLVMSSLVVVVIVPPVVDELFPPPSSCARAAVVIVIAVMGLRIRKPPANSVSAIIMMDTVAEVLPLPLFLEKDAFLSLSPLFFLMIDIIVLATAHITI
jgi:hypothetical protein